MVDEVFLTVTFSPVGVDTVKLDPDTPVTLPTDPPAAFVDRALDPPPDPASPTNPAGPPVCVVVVDGEVAAAELDVPPHAASPSPSAGMASATAPARMCLLNSRRSGLARPGSCRDIAPESWRLLPLSRFISAV